MKHLEFDKLGTNVKLAAAADDREVSAHLRRAPNARARRQAGKLFQIVARQKPEVHKPTALR